MIIDIVIIVIIRCNSIIVLIALTNWYKQLHYQLFLSIQFKYSVNKHFYNAKCQQYLTTNVTSAGEGLPL